MEVREPSAKYLARSGYKQSEIGVIPEDWEVKPIKEFAAVKGGKRLPLGWFVVDQVTPHPYLRVTDMRLGRVDLSDIKYVPDEAFPPIKNYRIFSDDIFISVAGSLGIVGKIPAELDGANLTENANKITAIQCDRDFLLHCLMSNRVQGIIEAEMTVGAQPKLALGRIENFVIGLPPTKVEQEAIAEALSDADVLIESMERLLAKKRNLKHGALQELLTGKKRLPGFSEGWETKPLGEIGRCHRGVSYNPSADLSPFDTDNTFRLLRSNNVQDAKIVFADIQFVDHERVSSDQVLGANDVLVCMANGSRELVGKAACFNADDGFRYTFGAFMGCFRPDKHKADVDFTFYLFQTEAYRRHIVILLAGSSINNLTPGSVEAHIVTVPKERAEQTAIAAILSDMDAEIAALEAKLAKARNLKQGMMQELLTGRIRLI